MVGGGVAVQVLGAKIAETIRAASEADTSSAEEDPRAVRGILRISVDFLSLIERGINALSFATLETMGRKLRNSVAALFTFEEGKLP